MNSLPVQIYNDVTSPTTAVVNRAWGAALTLVVMILVLNLIARLDLAKESPCMTSDGPTTSRRLTWSPTSRDRGPPRRTTADAAESRRPRAEPRRRRPRPAARAPPSRPSPG